MTTDMQGCPARRNPWPDATVFDEAAARALAAELLRAERLAFVQHAAGSSPPNQVLCTGKAGLAAINGCVPPDGEHLAHHLPPLVLVPRVMGRAFAVLGAAGGPAVEEGLATLRACGAADWHAEFMVNHAVQRGWQGLWVSGRAGFRRQVIHAARKHGLEAVSFDPGLHDLLA